MWRLAESGDTAIARSVLDKDTGALAHAQLGSCALRSRAERNASALGGDLDSEGRKEERKGASAKP